MKSIRILALTSLAVSLGLQAAQNSYATDGLKQLISAQQSKAQILDEEEPPRPRPQTPKLVGHSWDGVTQSVLDGQFSGLQIGVDAKLRPYVEWDEMLASVIYRSTDADGHLQLIAFDPLCDTYVTVVASPSVWTRSGQVTMMEGEYQIIKSNAQGRLQVQDQGSLGIIAILIGL